MHGPCRSWESWFPQALVVGLCYRTVRLKSEILARGLVHNSIRFEEFPKPCHGRRGDEWRQALQGGSVMKKSKGKAVQRCSQQGSRRRPPVNHLREWGRQQLRGGKSWAIVALTHALVRTANGIYEFEQSIERGDRPILRDLRTANDTEFTTAIQTTASNHHIRFRSTKPRRPKRNPMRFDASVRETAGSIRRAIKPERRRTDGHSRIWLPDFNGGEVPSNSTRARPLASVK